MRAGLGVLLLLSLAANAYQWRLAHPPASPAFVSMKGCEDNEVLVLVHAPEADGGKKLQCTRMLNWAR